MKTYSEASALVRATEMVRDRAWAEVEGATYDQATRRRLAEEAVTRAYGELGAAQL